MKPELPKISETDTDVDAYLDGEFELSRRLAIEQRLPQDAALQQRVQTAQALRDAVREHAAYHPAPAALRQRLSLLAVPQRALQRGVLPWQRSAWRPALAAAAVAGGVVAGMAFAAHVAWQRTEQREQVLAQLTSQVIASHVRATQGEHLLDVVSSDRHTVKPWLAARLDYSPPVHALALPGSNFIGARLDYVDQRPVAALVYRQGAHVVQAYVWPSAAPESEPAFIAQRGWQLAHWQHRGMAHWAVSDLNASEFSAVVQALRQADNLP